MPFSFGAPAAWPRVTVTVGVFFLVATVGTAAVLAGLSTTTAYTVGIGPTVSEVPSDATVVESETLPATVRDRVVDLAAGDTPRVRVEDSTIGTLGEPVYISHDGDYYAMQVTPQRTLTATGTLALGAVYLLSLFLGVSVPPRLRPHVH